jgi:hypothetical protein
MLLLVLLGTASADPKTDKAEARKHSQLGKAHYNLNDWDKAIAEFKIAYDLFPDPVNLYNIAQAYRLKGKKSCASAAEYYAKYQGEEKVKKLRESVTKVRKDMEDCAAKADEPLPVPPLNPVPATGGPPMNPAPINPGTPPAPVSTTGENALRSYEPVNLDPNRNRRMLSYVVIGVGSLSLLTGIGFSVKESDLAGQIADCKDRGITFRCGPLERDVEEIEDERSRTAARAGGSYLFGGGLVIGGFILYMVSRKPKMDRQTNVTVMPTRHGGAISWTF